MKLNIHTLTISSSLACRSTPASADEEEGMIDAPESIEEVPGGRAAGNAKKNQNKIILYRYYSITILIFTAKNYYNYDDATFVGVCSKCTYSLTSG